MSHLGFGLPYAIALQLQHPDAAGGQHHRRRLLRLHAERARHRAPLPAAGASRSIHNNAAWGIIRAGQRAQLDFEFGTGLEGTDYAAIARGFGCHGEIVTRARGRGAGDRTRARASGLPAVLDCRTRFVPHPAVPRFGSMNRFGFDALTRSAPTSMTVTSLLAHDRAP